MTKKVRLSSTQIWVIEQCVKNGSIKFWVHGSCKVSRPTAKRLIDLRICDYNDSYDGLVLTEMGKTYQL